MCFSLTCLLVALIICWFTCPQRQLSRRMIVLRTTVGRFFSICNATRQSGRWKISILTEHLLLRNSDVMLKEMGRPVKGTTQVLAEVSRAQRDRVSMLDAMICNTEAA